MTKGYELMIDFCTDAPAAQGTVYVKSKIKRRGTAGQCFQFSRRRKNKYLLRKKIQLEVIKKVNSVGFGIFEQLAYFLYPLIQRRFCCALLVFPMSGKTF